MSKIFTGLCLVFLLANSISAKYDIEISLKNNQTVLSEGTKIRAVIEKHKLST